MTPEPSQTRQDLEIAVRRLVGDTTSLAGDATSTIKTAGPALGVLAALLAFAWGRRRGRKRAAYVEVKRRK